MNTKFREIEFKYYADDISLNRFEEFCKERQPGKIVIASGYDHFYDKPKDSDSFCRHRVGHDSNQLTFKRKTTDVNNFVRTEHNLDLNEDMTEEQVQALCAEFGYRYNSSIFKNCFIYKYSDHTLVYYVVYNTDMNEVGRFVEIEMSETYPWKTKNEAWEGLVALERLFKPLGVSPQSRIKRSLFELFKKDLK